MLAGTSHLEDDPADGDDWGVGVRNAGKAGGDAAARTSSWRCCSAASPPLETDADVLADVDELRWTGPDRELVELAEQIGGLGLAERAIRLAERRGGT